MLADLKSKAVIEPRPVATLEERKYFLLVCEGERTEPLYFDYFKRILPKHLLEVQIIGAGDNTINVVKRAITERDKRAADHINPPYDETWAIFDKDDFPDDHFNDAIQLANNNRIKNGASNQAFELWYVLHFQLLQTALNRKGYFAILTKILGFKYEKNDPEVMKAMFAKGNIQKAIKWAGMLEQMHTGKTPSASWPSTNVYKLATRLLEYANL